MECSKVVVIGPYGCGKSAFTKVSAGEGFNPQHIRTLGVDVIPTVININGYTNIVNIWDRAGHPQFMGLADGYNVDANGIFICIDLSAPTLIIPTVPSASTLSSAFTPTPTPTPRVVYLGMKADIANRLTVAALDARGIRYIPVSAVQGNGINDAWKAMLTA
jgi:small GTP-binding protein